MIEILQLILDFAQSIYKNELVWISSILNFKIFYYYFLKIGIYILDWFVGGYSFSEYLPNLYSIKSKLEISGFGFNNLFKVLRNYLVSNPNDLSIFLKELSTSSLNAEIELVSIQNKTLSLLTDSSLKISKKIQNIMLHYITSLNEYKFFYQETNIFIDEFNKKYCLEDEISCFYKLKDEMEFDLDKLLKHLLNEKDLEIYESVLKHSAIIENSDFFLKSKSFQTPFLYLEKLFFKTYYLNGTMFSISFKEVINSNPEKIISILCIENSNNEISLLASNTVIEGKQEILITLNDFFNHFKKVLFLYGTNENLFVESKKLLSFCEKLILVELSSHFKMKVMILLVLNVIFDMASNQDLMIPLISVEILKSIKSCFTLFIAASYDYNVLQTTNDLFFSMEVGTRMKLMTINFLCYYDETIYLTCLDHEVLKKHGLHSPFIENYFFSRKYPYLANHFYGDKLLYQRYFDDPFEIYCKTHGISRLEFEASCKINLVPLKSTFYICDKIFDTVSKQYLSFQEIAYRFFFLENFKLNYYSSSYL